MTSMSRSSLWAMANSMAAMTALVLPLPVASSTLRPIRCTSGASPWYGPPPLPSLAIMLAMNVPWP